MAESRAIKRLLKALENIKAQVNTFTVETQISDIKTYSALLADEWRDFQTLEKTVKGKFDDAHEISVDKIESTHFELKHKLTKFEKLYEENHAYRGNCSMDDLLLNQSNFIQQMSVLGKRDSEVRLPRVNIPPFSGKYSEFSSFRDLFEASIHKNNNISKVHKLQYLKGLLKGEAYALINHITVTDANYDEAWDKIKIRYDKRKHVVHTLLKQFMEQPNLHQSCSKALRQLSEVSDEVMRGLKVLGEQAESRDPWIIYILTNKLDNDSKEAWAHETAENDFPTLDQLFAFLNKRSDALENLNSMQKSKGIPAKRINSLISHSISVICPLCSEEHYLGKCEQFLNLRISGRKQLAAEKKLCFNCLSSNHQATVCRSRFNCKICKRRHHITLHPESAADASKETGSSKVGSSSTEESTNCSALLKMESPQTNKLQAILPTAMVLIKDKFGKLQRCRALLDSGSQATFVSENCVQRLQLKRHTANVRITGVTNSSIISKGKTVITIGSLYDSASQFDIDALIVNHLPSRLPRYNIISEDTKLFQNMQLADPDYGKPAPIDILIGADKFFTVLESGQKQFNSIVLQKTVFGWIVSGQPQSANNEDVSTFMALNIQLDMDIDGVLRKFWEIEEVPKASEISPEEQECEEFFLKTHKRQDNGRYVVHLPFNKSANNLGDSLNTARQRFFSLERKLSSDESLRSEYTNQMREYIEMGHMVEIPETRDIPSQEKIFYLPHHSVRKESSNTTKIRVVFDGSSKSATGISLNDKLMVGPTIQPTLWSTLLRFRRHRIAVIADIEKMYRQIIVASHDADYQRVLWRENANQKLRHYKLTRVTFGLACSAYLAIRTLQQLARDDGDDHIYQHVVNDFYVDDFLSGSQDEQGAIQLKENISRVLQQGGFLLRKWRSNIQVLCDEVNNTTTTQLYSDKTSIVTVLGLHWYPKDDIFTFKVNPEQDGQITKRKLISEASRVFDPLGFLSPSVILLKILFQKLWLLKIDWDDKLPEEFEKEYRKVRGEFSYFEQVKIPRFINHCGSVQIHGFADASEVAYSAVIYSRVTNQNGEITINLLTSKTKVTPIKKISIPRLELCAAQLLSQLMSTVKETLASTASFYAWTDSAIVLAWLSAYPARWKTFIANRTSQILDKFPVQHWGHVKSSDNPADHGSRGVSPQRLLNLTQWWHGPEWLKSPENLWPMTFPNNTSSEAVIEKELNKSKLHTRTLQATIDDDWLGILFARKSKLTQIYRIVAYVIRYTINSKKHRNTFELNSKEISDAKTRCIIWVQNEAFSDNTIEWHFIPPAAPHFGGLWESAVKSVKTHLLKSTKNVNLTFEEMTTLLCQIENILNSRPLCTTSVDDDYEVLTPAHFLIGTSTGSVPETQITTAAESSLSRWQRIQARIQTFWKKYHRDYLNNLQQRHKWQKPMPSIEVGDIVLIKEENVPVCKWPLGRVLHTHPGDDNLVRVATIKTTNSTLKRPIVKLCKLPVG